MMPCRWESRWRRVEATTLKQSKPFFLDGLAQKNVALRSFETSGTTHRMMQHHIAKDSHLHIFIDLRSWFLFFGWCLFR